MLEFKVHHVCIQTNCYEESLRFYIDYLGFKVLKKNEFFSGRRYNTWLESANFMIELQTPKLENVLNEWDSNTSGPVHLAFIVSDVEAAYTFFLKNGYSRFKFKGKKVIYSLNENSSLFKVFAPEGTEIEIRNAQLP